MVERCLALVTHRIVTISPAQRHDIVERFRVAPMVRTTTIPLGLALEPLLALQPGAPDLRERLGLGAEDVIVGFLGRMVPIKDLPTLVNAFAIALERIPNMRLLLAGDGPERPVLTQLAERLGIEERVVFLGWVDDLPRFYATLDVCAISSINEGTPVAIIEAMAAARPVAASAVGGVVDIVEQDVTGLLVPPRDPPALANAIVALSQSPDERRRMGQQGRRRATGYTEGRLVDDLERLYQEGLAEVRNVATDGTARLT
jgi:glycosyltransferase involved in cell wall biosynthesis